MFPLEKHIRKSIKYLKENICTFYIFSSDVSCHIYPGKCNMRYSPNYICVERTCILMQIRFVMSNQ